ncbi:CG10194 [Drosophila busckii]|uniref:CG10194 n=1 Tax=Drosophila busckii TaxID=30019 RepID=A0A0M4E5Q9_DROBS|nr:nucleoside diphosphate-linked moiety X motif 19 [Drosophila busckii]ALC39496.1 CG10194 [Drosophila busckii]
MSKLALNKIRQSASLLILAKTKNAGAHIYDYNALLLTRTSKSSFMPDSSVFPGGVCDLKDASPAWLEHFQRYDISAAKLTEICKITTHDNNNELETPLSLRLTALRETFEEMGILLCRDRKTLTSTSGYAQFHEQFDRKHWQHMVHNDASKFLTLCQQLDVLPDVWALHEWSAWRTPSTFKKRFQTAFFLTALEQQPCVLTEANEVKDYSWRSPLDYLQAALKKELWLPPPQFYELSRCLNFNTLKELRQFACMRASNGCILMHPVMYKCTDGQVHLLPGDDMYPVDADSCNDKIETGLSTKEFRALAKNLHRSEHKNQHESELLINFQPADGQVNPLDPRKC